VESVRATVIHGAGDVRIEDVPDPKLVEPTDALVRVTSACICDSHSPSPSRARRTRAPCGLDDVPSGYQAMADREALKVLVRP
jgi:threonine dehydrogenase-like Zn-dependent dehydrogenase